MERRKNETDLADEIIRGKCDPMAYHFSKLQWSAIGTLTWKDEKRREDTKQAQALREREFRRLIHFLATQIEVPLRKIAFYHKMERGRGGECHFHILVMVPKQKSSMVAGLLMLGWNVMVQPAGSKKHGIGQAEIWPFDQSRAIEGVSYVMKRERDQFGEERPSYSFYTPRLNAFIRQIQEDREVDSTLGLGGNVILPEEEEILF